jgi:hypothetical protein
MKIKLSDFILENSIDVDANVDDITFETALAELNVNAKIMEYYLKQMNMNVVMEAAPAQQPPTMPTKDQLTPNSPYVQSYDTDESTEAVKQALREIGCEVSTNKPDNGVELNGDVNGYFEVQSYDGRADIYAFTYYSANSTVGVQLVDGHNSRNPYSVEHTVEINPNKNIKSQFQTIANTVIEDLQDYYTDLKDYKNYKADPNNSLYKGYRDNVDVGLNEGMGNAMKNALKDSGFNASHIAIICSIAWSICRLIATIYPLLYSVLNKLKRAAGMKSRSDADAKMIGTLTPPSRDLDNAFTVDLFNMIDENKFIDNTLHCIDKMYYTLQAMNILTKKSDMDSADFQNMVSESM